jgi:hypothetical protein
VSSSGSASEARIGAIVGGVLGGMTLLAIALLLISFELRKRRKEMEERAAEKLDSSDVIESPNYSNRSGPSNTFNNHIYHGRIDTSMPAVNYNFVNLVSPLGLSPNSGRTVVPAPPSYASNVQHPYIQPPSTQILRPSMENSMQSMPRPPPFVIGSGPVDAVWLISYAGAQRERRREIR